MLEDAGIEPGTVATFALTLLCSILGKDGEDEEHVSILLELVSRSVQRTEQCSTPLANSVQAPLNIFVKCFWVCLRSMGLNPLHGFFETGPFLGKLIRL
jgi:hypothetical protein